MADRNSFKERVGMSAKYLGIGDSAAYLSVSPKTIRRMVARGELTAYRVGPKILRIDAEELDAVLRRVPSAGDAA